MSNRKIYLGQTPLQLDDEVVGGEFVNINGEDFYRISHFDHMDDFFMTIVSDSDHWMFISSNGSLSAGREDRDSALFPYYSDDKITDYQGMTGSSTAILVEKAGSRYLWQPFSLAHREVYNAQRNLYKSFFGDKIIFEEVNDDLNLSFRYGWYTSDRFGFIKKSSITNLGDGKMNLSMLDGITNILPCGVDYNFQNEYSNLLDGYKKSELLSDTGIGLFMLSSIPVDRAEPSESLNATTVWSAGMREKKILLSTRQVSGFCKGLEVHTEEDVRATRGAYYVQSELMLDAGQEEQWLFAAEVNQASSDVANLQKWLRSSDNPAPVVDEDIALGTDKLMRIVAAADGLQKGEEALSTTRHYSNTLFNVMRGGTYLDNYRINSDDFRDFVQQTNLSVSQNCQSILDQLPDTIQLSQLAGIVQNAAQTDLIRIFHEYLPLTFSRRHGDPSRPWNIFSIQTKNADGSPRSDFQGNWRDIFQNWEALSLSYPEFIEHIISKFLNASTADGYNPYRIMRSGMDWECPDPEDPWAYIGYWGDHQIIYLQKLLELSEHYHPGKLDTLLASEIFAFANVPYRIKPYQEIVRNPKDSITFDFELNDQIADKVGCIGADGRLIQNREGGVLHVNMCEKIMITLMTKLSNFIPEAGIWLNTQRPEWNDANNALVGNGASMVTLYYLRRFLAFWHRKFNGVDLQSIEVSVEVRELFDEIFNLFEDNIALLKDSFSDQQRKLFADTLGEAGWQYRSSIYQNAFSGKKEDISTKKLAEFMSLALQYIDHSIKHNIREDGLYHAYNLVSFDGEGVSIRYLYEMLEGQVAILSAGCLDAPQSLDVLDSLRNSKLFRRDQYSYLLYPDRQLPRFDEKNNIPTERIQSSKLLMKLVAEKDNAIVSMDDAGQCHFNGSFRNANLVNAALDKLDKHQYGELVKEERGLVLDIYEEMFDHKSFTGRSGTFYAYEGLGSIYWHMVSKLLLATEECYFNALDSGAEDEICGKLKDHYYEIKAGIGIYKSPALYGAFPTDPYSHTPGQAGAKQPGMTGQVKEDFIARMGELGVRVENGQIVFDPRLMNEKEISSADQRFAFVNLDGEPAELDLANGQLAFTVCQTPVVYTLSPEQGIKLTLSSGETVLFDGNTIDARWSSSIFHREGAVRRIDVSIKSFF
jgi:hypothetical protein